MSSTAAEVAAAAAKVKTVGQARAALGVVSRELGAGYALIPGITTVAEEQAAARLRLDGVNAYAQKVYAEFSDDDISQRKLVTPLQASKVGLCIGQAHRALADVHGADPAWSFAQILADGVATGAGWVGGGIQAVTNAAGAGFFAFVRAAWPTLLIAAAVVAALFYLRRRVGKAVIA